MREVGIAAATAYGTYLLYTALALGWTGLGPGPSLGERRCRRSTRDWLAEAGLEEVGTAELAGVVAGLGLLGAALGFALFAGPLPAVATAVAAASTPVASYRYRRELRRSRSAEAWPRMIEEMRLRTGSLGRSVPQAFFEVGERGPVEMAVAFGAARREWQLTTDFERSLAVFKSHLADPTADSVCETLLVAHQVGGANLGQRLAALAEDRVQDLQGRKDARARQAGARLARRFVVFVPIGMALAGMQIGEGRRAYSTSTGQVAVLVAIALIGVCWSWAGRVMRLPRAERVFR